MVELKWLDSFDVGVPEIDDQHHEMMMILKQIQAAITERCLQTTKKLIIEFIHVTKGHFTTEEKILEEANFPRLKEHRVVHGQLLARAIEIRNIIHEAAHVDELEECIIDLAEFLFHDLIGSDMEFKSHLQACGMAQQDLKIL